MRTPKRLVEIFTEHKPIVKGKSQRGRYEALYEVIPKPPSFRRRVTLQSVKEYVENLQQRYPEKEFKLYRVKIEGKEYVVITRKAHWKDYLGRRHEVTDRASIYVDLEEQRFYVPFSLLKRRRKMVNYAILRTLGALGVSTVRYLRPA